MKYIWQNYSASNDFYIEKKPFSPYLETANIGKNKIGVNPVLRLYEIFFPLFENPQTPRNEPLENCLLHYLAQLDLKSGIHLTSLLEHRLHREICEKVFGEKAQKLYLSLSENERRIFLIYLQRHEAAQGLKSFFFEAVLQFFPSTKFYFYEWEQKFLFCIPARQTEHNEKLMELLIFFLFDMGAAYEIFWNSHFGIIDDKETMQLDDFVIY